MVLSPASLSTHVHFAPRRVVGVYLLVLVVVVFVVVRNIRKIQMVSVLGLVTGDGSGLRRRTRVVVFVMVSPSNEELLAARRYSVDPFHADSDL